MMVGRLLSYWEGNVCLTSEGYCGEICKTCLIWELFVYRCTTGRTTLEPFHWFVTHAFSGLQSSPTWSRIASKRTQVQDVKHRFFESFGSSRPFFFVYHICNPPSKYFNLKLAHDDLIQSCFFSAALWSCLFFLASWLTHFHGKIAVPWLFVWEKKTHTQIMNYYLLGVGLKETSWQLNGQEQILKKEGNWSLNGSTGRYAFDSQIWELMVEKAAEPRASPGLGLFFFFFETYRKVEFFFWGVLAFRTCNHLLHFWLRFQCAHFFELGDLRIQERWWLKFQTADLQNYQQKTWGILPGPSPWPNVLPFYAHRCNTYQIIPGQYLNLAESW